jgi:hypothetical protein
MIRRLILDPNGKWKRFWTNATLERAKSEKMPKTRSADFDTVSF